ncbi:MAG TPA: hypothetical protein VK272_14060 [Solirubrobacteraceae bacterium]|nr:hypothetical protein [Solirubrobacteraceae bacterium]
MQRLRPLIAAIAALALPLGLTQPASALPLSFFQSHLPAGCTPEHLIFGPSNSLWFVIRGCEVNNHADALSAVEQIPITNPKPKLVKRLKKLPDDLTVGPEGNLWLAEESSGEHDLPKIGRLTPAGQLTQFETPIQAGLPGSQHERPKQIIVGPENDLWFVSPGNGSNAEGGGSNILGRITPQGAVSQFPAPLIPSGRGKQESKADEVPRALAKAANGNLWMEEQFEEGTIGLIEPGGVIKQIRVGESGQGIDTEGDSMVATPEGGLWFRERGGGLTLLNPSGEVQARYSLRENVGWEVDRSSVTTGDDALWVTTPREVLARITSSGTGEIAFCSTNEAPEQIAIGPEGDLWFSAYDGSAFGRLALPQLIGELEREPTQARICGAKATPRRLEVRVACESLNISNTCAYQATVTLADNPGRVLGTGRFVAYKGLHEPESLNVSLRPAIRSLLHRHRRLKLRLTLRSGTHVAASRLVTLRG